MPINESEFNEGKIENGLNDAILDYLNGDKSQAFTAMEILDHLKQFSKKPWGKFLTEMGSLRPIRAALSGLESEGKIESKTIELEEDSSDTYYKIILVE